MSTFKEELQSRLNQPTRSRRHRPERILPDLIDPELIDAEINKLTPAQRWTIRGVHGLTGQASMSVEEFARSHGDYDSSSAELIYKNGMNALAYQIWLALRPKPTPAEEPPTPPAEITEPHKGVYIDGQAASAETYNNLQKRMDEFDLSVRATNTVVYIKIVRIGDLVQHTEAEILKTRHAGRRVVREFNEILAEIGLRLGMKVEGWTPDTTVQPTSRGYQW